MYDIEEIKLISPEEDFARRKAAGWLIALIDNGIIIDDTFFHCVGWIVGGMRALAARFKSEFLIPRGKEHGHARAIMKSIDKENYKRIEDSLDSMYSQYELMRRPMLDFVRKLMVETAKRKSADAGKNFARKLATLFGLSRLDLDICYFAFTLSHFRNIERYFEDVMEIASYPKRQLFGALFGVNGAEVYSRCVYLENMGILELRHGNIRLTDNVEAALLADSIRDAKNLFCKPAGKAKLALDQFLLPQAEIAHASRLMGSKGNAPAHLLLYGAPGSGKTSFASALAHSLNVKAWTVQCNESDDTQDRRASLTACLKMASAHKGAIVIVDEAERLLDTSVADITEGTPKAWINELLERKSTRVIWITNKVSHLDQAVRRRFSYSIHFRAPAQSDRESMWNLATARLKAEKFLPLDKRKQFAKNYPVSFATIELALRQARQLCWNKNFPAWVERVLKAQVALTHNGASPRTQDHDQALFEQDAICIGESLQDFLRRVEKLAERMAKAPQPGHGSMLFYGPPGTGKTALARHLADLLRRKLIIRRASDLLNMYVGGTEERIAEAFAEAERSEGILLVDEVDSFIGSRAGAQHSWEVSMVNEFLTSLETFSGLCICTTNFHKTLDPAAMRRFFIKLEFTYAGPRQIERLYKSLLEPLAGSPIPTHLLAMLTRQKFLTPGDFATCKKKFWLDDKPEHEQMVDSLVREQTQKMEGTARAVGF